jgi:hypothetical protein
MDSKKPRPNFGDHETNCVENAVDSVVVLPSQTRVTSGSRKIRFTLYNRADETFTQTGHFQLREQTDAGNWEQVGPEIRNFSPVLLEPGQSTDWWFTFATQDSDSSSHTIVPPEGAETEYAFLVPGSLESGEVEDYITRFVAEF